MRRTGIVQGYRSLFLQDENGSLLDTHSISAGLDYAGIGPQLAHTGGGKTESSLPMPRTAEVLEAVRMTAESVKGILPALESAPMHWPKRSSWPPRMSTDTVLVVNVSGRGDKDLFITAPHFDGEDWLAFLKNEVARLEGGGKRDRNGKNTAQSIENVSGSRTDDPRGRAGIPDLDTNGETDPADGRGRGRP